MAERTLRFSSTLVVYPEGVDKPGVEIWCRDGFVSRVVSAVAGENIPDAEQTARKLNAYDEMFEAARKVLDQRANGGWLVNGPAAVEALDELEDAIAKAEARANG